MDTQAISAQRFDAVCEELALDRQALLDCVMSSRELAVRVLRMYLGDLSYQRLADAIEQAADDAAVRRAAHTLKGVAANLSFGHMRALAASLMEAADAGERHSYPALFEQIAREQARVTAILRKL